MAAIFTAFHSTELPEGGLKEWYQLLPSGVFKGRDGRGPYVLDTQGKSSVIKAFSRLKCDLPVDYEHQSLEAKEKSGPVPAAGWIKELSARDDGLWARVEWTPVAASCLKAKEYRYISPVFIHDKDGNVKAITMAALTNTPNLFIQAASSRQENTMDEFKEKICALLGLDPAASDDEVLEAVGALKGEGESVNSEGEDDEPKEDEEKKEAAQSTKSAKSAKPSQAVSTGIPDPTKYVPMELFVAVNTQLATLQSLQGKEKAADRKHKLHFLFGSPVFCFWQYQTAIAPSNSLALIFISICIFIS